MKRAFAMLAMLALLAACFSVPAFAGDSGEERLIPVKLWKCSICGATYHTFPSDIIAGSSGQTQLVDGNYQQSYFKTFKDPGRSIPKCPRGPVNGGHTFVPVTMETITPQWLAFNSDKIIVLANGKNNAVQMYQLKCLLCGDQKFCFTHDDLDQWEPIVLKQPSQIHLLSSPSSLYKPCTKKYTDGRNTVELKHHIFSVEGAFTPSSAWEIARNANRIVFSD